MTRKPKIQLHLPNLYVGGIERWALTLLHGLPEIDWFISTPAGAASHQAGLNDFSDFTIIHETDHWTPKDALITTWGTANRSVIPTIAVAHSAFEKYREMMQAVRYDFAVAVSQDAKTCFPDSSQIDVIYNGVDTTRLNVLEPKVAVRARLGIPEDAVVVGYVGRWGFQKNPLAAAIAAASVPGAIALYVGPAPEDQSLVDQAKRIATCRFVTPEDVGNIGDLYGAMDVCMFASRTEGFGLAIAEAWYSLVPVIATKVGIAAEHPDLVQLLPDDPTEADLKHALQIVISGKSNLNLHKCRKVVLENYTAQRMIDDWRSYIFSKLAS